MLTKDVAELKDALLDRRGGPLPVPFMAVTIPEHYALVALCDSHEALRARVETLEQVIRSVIEDADLEIDPQYARDKLRIVLDKVKRVSV